MKVEAGTIIGVVSCPGCGQDKPLKVNQSGNVGLLCRHPVGTDPATGKREDCYMRISYGRVASARLIADYTKTREEQPHAEHTHEPEPAGSEVIAETGGDEPPEPIPAAIAGNADRKPERRGLTSWFD